MPIANVTRAFAYESITITNAAASGLTAATLESSGAAGPAKRAVITVETNQIRYRVDGTAPTTTEGHIAETGDTLVLEGTEDLRGFRAISTAAGGSTLKVTYERE